MGFKRSLSKQLLHSTDPRHARQPFAGPKSTRMTETRRPASPRRGAAGGAPSGPCRPVPPRPPGGSPDPGYAHTSAWMPDVASSSRPSVRLSTSRRPRSCSIRMEGSIRTPTGHPGTGPSAPIVRVPGRRRRRRLAAIGDPVDVVREVSQQLGDRRMNAHEITIYDSMIHLRPLRPPRPGAHPCRGRCLEPHAVDAGKVPGLSIPRTAQTATGSIVSMSSMESE